MVDLNDDCDALRISLRAAAHDVGFFYLTGHGVSDDLTQRLLAAARGFFALLQLPDALAAGARGVTADPSDEQIFPVYGRNAWKSRLRAHPDVAAAHGYMG